MTRSDSEDTHISHTIFFFVCCFDFALVEKPRKHTVPWIPDWSHVCFSRMLRSLLSSDGVNPQMITVFIDGYYEVLSPLLLNIFFFSQLFLRGFIHIYKLPKSFLVRNPWMWWISSVLKEFSIRLSVLRMLECHRWYVCDFVWKWTINMKRNGQW